MLPESSSSDSFKSDLIRGTYRAAGQLSRYMSGIIRVVELMNVFRNAEVLKIDTSKLHPFSCNVEPVNLSLYRHNLSHLGRYVRQA